MPRWIKELAASLLATAAVLFAIYRLTPVVSAQGHGGAVWGSVADGTTEGTLPFNAPVLVGGVGNDGNRHKLATNNSGQTILSASANPGSFSASGSALTDGQPNNPAGLTFGSNGVEPIQIYPFQLSGSTWDRLFYCSNGAHASIGATTTQLVAGVASQRIRICSFIIERTDTTAVATRFQFVEGTGTNCGTGQTNTTGILLATGATAPTLSEPSLVYSGGNQAPIFTSTAADALCGTETGAASSMDVTITYEQH